jgi:hypothetical protein
VYTGAKKVDKFAEFPLSYIGISDFPYNRQLSPAVFGFCGEQGKEFFQCSLLFFGSVNKVGINPYSGFSKKTIVSKEIIPALAARKTKYQ